MDFDVDFTALEIDPNFVDNLCICDECKKSFDDCKCYDPWCDNLHCDITFIVILIAFCKIFASFKKFGAIVAISKRAFAKVDSFTLDSFLFNVIHLHVRNVISPLRGFDLVHYDDSRMDACAIIMVCTTYSVENLQ